MFGSDFWKIAHLIQLILRAIEAIFGEKNVDNGYAKHVGARKKKPRQSS